MQTKTKPDIFEIMVLTPEEATKMLWEELEKDNPDLELIKDILAYSPVDVKVRDYWDLTALIVAAKDGKEKCVELLLNHPGIDVNVQNKYGERAWNLATHSIRQKFPSI